MNHIIKINLRNLTKKPIYSIITFTGFTFGIVASLLIYLWVYNELSYEKFHPDYERIYRVLTLSKQGDKIIKSAICYTPVAETMKMDYPQIEYATYISDYGEDSPLLSETGGEKIEARKYWTNDNFFQIFRGFKFIEGSFEKVFDNQETSFCQKRLQRKFSG